VALNSFFSSPGDTQSTTFEWGGREITQSISHCQSPSQNKFWLIVDEKLPKPPHSFLRKSFEEELGEIRDFFSVNFVLPEEHYRGIGFEERVGILREIFKNFLDFLESQYPESKIKIIREDKSGIESYQQKVIVQKGKRSGSMASFLNC